MRIELNTQKEDGDVSTSREFTKKYNVTALVRMEKVRASQLLPLRKNFKEK